MKFDVECFDKEQDSWYFLGAFPDIESAQDLIRVKRKSNKWVIDMRIVIVLETDRG